jgi:hypothetical protein
MHVQVICATCAAAGSDMLAGATFPLVVLDEASQAAEPEALIPLTRGAEHVVLVGDHLQLPPVCNSEAAAAAGLAVSLFERLMAAGVPSAMLQVGNVAEWCRAVQLHSYHEPWMSMCMCLITVTCVTKAQKSAKCTAQSIAIS